MRGRAWLRAVRLLNVAPLVRRPMRVSLAVVSVAAGATLLSAVVIEEQSLTTSVHDVARTLAGPTPLRVVGPSSHGGLDERMVARIRALPGVRAAVPMVQTVAWAQGRRSHRLVIALGVDCSVQAVVGSFGCSPTAMAHARGGQAPLIGPALVRSLGADPFLRTDLGRIPLAHAATTTLLSRLNGGRVAVFPLRQAQQEFDRTGQLDTVYVAPAPGVSARTLQRLLRHVLPAQDKVLRADQPPLAASETGLMVPLLALIALLALGVAALLVFNIMSLTFAERRRELAIAAAVGATDRLTVAGALVEAAVQGAAGGLLGSLGGILLAHPLVASASKPTELFTGIHLHVHASATTLVVGPIVGVVTAVAAAWLPARRAARVDVVAELHARSRPEAHSSVRRPRAAVLTLTAGVIGVMLCVAAGRHAATAPWQPPVGELGIVVTMVAFTAVTLVLAPMAIRGLHPWARRRGGVTDVAIGALVAEPRRTGVAATAVAAAVSFSSLLVAAIPAIDAVTVQLFGNVIGGRVYVSTLDFNNTALVDSKLSPSLRARLARLPGVAGVDQQVFVTAPVDGTRATISAVDFSPPAFTAVEGATRPASLDRGEAFVGPALARMHHLHPGSAITIDSPAGRIPLRVGAVWEDPNNVGLSVSLGMRQLTRMFGSQPPTAVFVRGRTGVSPDALAATIRRAQLEPGLVVQTPGQFLAALATSVRAMLGPFWTLQRALLVVALVATLSTLLLVGVQRRRELGTLAALGLSPRALARMTLTEAAVVGAVGGAFGLASGAVNVVGMLSDAVFITGASPAFNFDVAAAARYALLALAVVVVGAGWPAWRTSRLQVVDALRHE